jgi:hypothetical protein
MATQRQLFIMGPYDNLGFSLFPQHDTPMSSNDIQLEYQAPQIPQSHNAFPRPSSTGTTRSPTPIPPWQAGSSLLLQGRNGMEEYPSQVLLPFATHNQSDGSETSLYTPSPPRSVSSSPSYPCKIPATFSGKSKRVKYVLIPELSLGSRASMPFDSNAGHFS